MVESISKKIIRNTFYNSVGRMWMMLLTLLLTPYILHKLGVQLFAVWSLIFVITTCLGFLDLGIGSSFSKYIAEYWAKKDYSSLNSVIGFGILFFTICSAVIFFLAYLLKGPLMWLLKVPELLQKDFTYGVIGMVVVVSLVNIFSVFREFLFGVQRMDILNKIIIFSSLFYIFFTIFFLEKGMGIEGLVYSTGIRGVVLTLSTVFFSLKLFPTLRITFFPLNMNVFKKLFNYGIKMQVSNIAGMVHLQTDKVVISYFLGLNFVTFYELGQKIATAGRSLPAIILSALVPAISEIDTYNDHTKLKDLYYKGSKYIALTIFPLIFLTLTLASDVIHLWVGKGYPLAILALQVLVIEYGLNVLTGMGTSVVRGIGKPEYETRYAVLVMILQLILSIILIQLMGFKGILLSLLVSGLSGSFYFLVTFHKFFRESFKDLAKKVYSKPFFASGFAALITFIFSSYLKSLAFFPNRWGSLIWLSFEFLIFLISYTFFIIKMSYLEINEVQPLTVYFKPKLANKICSIFSK